MPRLTPYVLLGVLVLGTGLGAGLGLSEAPVSNAASRPPPRVTSPQLGAQFQRCVTFTTPTEVGVRCSAAPGQWGMSVGVTFETHVPRARAACLAGHALLARGPGALRRAIAWLRAQCVARR